MSVVEVQSLSNNVIKFTQAPSNFIVAAQDAGSAPEEQGNRFNMKEIQRRAYERGVSVERAKYSGTLKEILELVRGQAEQIKEAMVTDREKIESFAVKLAVGVVEKLTCTLVDEGRYDVVAMVSALLDEVDNDTRSNGLTLKLNPHDHQAILEGAENTGISLDGIDIVADAMIPKGSPHLVGGDTEYYADMNERLEQLSKTLIEESHHASS